MLHFKLFYILHGSDYLVIFFMYIKYIKRHLKIFSFSHDLMDRCKSHVIVFKTSLSSFKNDYICTASFLTGLVHETKIKCDKAKGYRKKKKYEKVVTAIKFITQDDSLNKDTIMR